MQENKIILVDWSESRWLVLTSSTFFIPTIYSFYCQLYGFSGISLFTTIISMNYWRRATISFRRDLDLVFAKISFVIYLIHGIYYIRGNRLFLFLPALIYLLYNYYNSNLLYTEKKKEWINHHIWFHLMVLFEQMIIIESTSTSTYLSKLNTINKA